MQDGPREDRSASLLRLTAKLAMSETCLSLHLNFYGDFQSPKLNMETLCCITASSKKPIDTAKCAYLHMDVHVCT